jgi:hypothetical protein
MSRTSRGSEAGVLGYSMMTLDRERVAGYPATLWFFGAADRIRTGDVQLGKQAERARGLSRTILFAPR